MRPPPLEPQANWHSQIFKLLWKVVIRIGADLTPGGKFQRMGAMAEKALLLESTSQNSLADRAHSMPSVTARVGQSQWDKLVPQVT